MDFKESILTNCRGRYRVEWFLPCLVEMGLDPEMRIQAFDTFAQAVNKFMRLKAQGIYEIRLHDRDGKSMWRYCPKPDSMLDYEQEV